MYKSPAPTHHHHHTPCTSEIYFVCRPHPSTSPPPTVLPLCPTQIAYHKLCCYLDLSVFPMCHQLHQLCRYTLFQNVHIRALLDTHCFLQQGDAKKYLPNIVDCRLAGCQLKAEGHWLLVEKYLSNSFGCWQILLKLVGRLVRADPRAEILFYRQFWAGFPSTNTWVCLWLSVLAMKGEHVRSVNKCKLPVF